MSNIKTTITWWGASSVEIAAGLCRLAIDPFEEPHEARVQCICVTREDYDHCDVETIRKLTSGPTFQRLVVPRSCMAMERLDAPVVPGADSLAFVGEDRITVLYPRYGRSPLPPDRQGSVEVAGFVIEAVESSDRAPVFVLDRWPRYRSANWTSWPGDDGAFVGMGAFTPLGYVVTHAGTGLTAYHPGDLQEVFDCHYELRGRIDYMFLPVGAAHGIELSLVDAVRPRYVVPIHYRPGGPDAALSAGMRPSAVDTETGYPVAGVDTNAYRTEMRRLVSHRWFPCRNSPLERLKKIKSELEELGATLLILKPGKAHTIDEDAQRGASSGYARFAGGWGQ